MGALGTEVETCQEFPDLEQQLLAVLRLAQWMPSIWHTRSPQKTGIIHEDSTSQEISDAHGYRSCSRARTL